MYISSGYLKGRKIIAPKNISVRPTTNKAKTALFNILIHQFKLDFNNLKVLDLFCGIGGVSYEFISRGVYEIDCVDNHPKCLNFLKKMAIYYNVFDKINLYYANAYTFLRKQIKQYNLIFADPPNNNLSYKKIPWLIEIILKKKLISSDGLLIIEHLNNIYSHIHNTYHVETRKYGKIYFSFFKV